MQLMQVKMHKKARKMLLDISDYYAEYGGLFFRGIKNLSP